MIWDDLELDKKPKNKPKDLSPMSQEELKDYVEALKAEIERAETEIKRKKAHLSAADGFFKK